MTQNQSNKRQLILDTALDIIEAEGMKALTQPRIAKVSGIRQSHLTYYFPRKADLYVALLDASHERARRSESDAPTSIEEMLAALFFSKERMRFFLAIALEIGDDPALQSAVRRHAEGLSAEIGRQTGRYPDDPRLISFIDEMRGLGLRVLFSSNPPHDALDLLRAVAARHSLKLY